MLYLICIMGLRGGLKLCNLSRRNGGDPGAGGRSGEGEGGTWTQPGGPLLPAAPLLPTTAHSSPQGPTAGLARNYGPVIG